MCCIAAVGSLAVGVCHAGLRCLASGHLLACTTLIHTPAAPPSLTGPPQIVNQLDGFDARGNIKVSLPCAAYLPLPSAAAPAFCQPPSRRFQCLAPPPTTTLDIHTHTRCA